MYYIVTTAENYMFKFSQPYRIPEEEYSAALYNNSMLCGSLYLEELLEGIFIEVLHPTIRKNAHNHHSKNGYEDIGTLARHVS